MKVNFNITLQNYKGHTLQHEDGHQILIKEPVCNVLSLVTDATPKEKIEIGNLIKVIWESDGAIDLTPEQCVMIRKHLERLPVSTFSQIYQLFE